MMYYWYVNINHYARWEDYSEFLYKLETNEFWVSPVMQHFKFSNIRGSVRIRHCSPYALTMFELKELLPEGISITPA